MSLCFVLHGSLSKAVILSLTEAMLNLGNLLVLDKAASESLATSPNQIGVCLIRLNKDSYCDELQILMQPKGSFKAREYHRVINNISSDWKTENSHVAEKRVEINRQISAMNSLVDNKALDMFWDSKKSPKNIVYLCDSIMEADSTFTDTLLEAEKNSIQIQFIALHMSISDDSKAGRSKEFRDTIERFGNCSFSEVNIDPWLLDGMSKEWFSIVANGAKKWLFKTTLKFKEPLLPSVSTIQCVAVTKMISISRQVKSCNTCRCHGTPLMAIDHCKSKAGCCSFCSVTNKELDIWDCHTNAVQIGKQTVLHLPSFQDVPSNPTKPIDIELNVIIAIKLNTLCEGLLYGKPFLLGANSNQRDDCNEEVFSALCQFLVKKDFGLLCKSNIDINRQDSSLMWNYYLIVPGNDSLLLRRIIAREEFLGSKLQKPRSPSNDVLRSVCESLSSVGSFIFHHFYNKMALWQPFLLQLDVQDYNPLDFELGCHRQISLLAKQSLNVESRSAADEIRPSMAAKEAYGFDAPLFDSPELESAQHADITPSQLPSSATLNLRNLECAKRNFAEESMPNRQSRRFSTPRFPSNSSNLFENLSGKGKAVGQSQERKRGRGRGLFLKPPLKSMDRTEFRAASVLGMGSSQVANDPHGTNGRLNKQTLK